MTKPQDKDKKQARRTSARKTARTRRRLAWGAGIVAVALVAWISYGPVPWGDGLTHGRSFHVKGGEMAPVLNALQFGATHVRQAYLAASTHRDTLDQVYCYCLCDRPPFNHKSLLSCFTDYHGSG